MIWKAFIEMIRSFYRPPIPTLQDIQDQCDMSEMPHVRQNRRGEWVTIPRWRQDEADGH